MNDIAPGTNHDSLRGSAPPYSAVPWLIAILLLGVWLRCSQAHESLWLDELHTSWVVADGAGQIADRARAGNQSPLYFDLVWCVVQLLGHHEWTLRLLSLVAGSGLILATYELVRRWSHSVTSGLLAALLVAVSRDCIFYAQEARPYALLQLSAVAHARVVRRPVVASDVGPPSRLRVRGRLAVLPALHELPVLAGGSHLSGRVVGCAENPDQPIDSGPPPWMPWRSAC